MTCQEALKLLYEIIDKEANQIDTEKVREHLENCRDCLARYEFEAMFRTFVTEKAASALKTEQLKHRIMARLDEPEPPRGFFARLFRSRGLLFSAGALLIVFVVAALATAQLYRHRALVYPFEKNHLQGIAASIQETQRNVPVTEFASFTERNLHLAINWQVPDFELVNCSYDDIAGQKIAHLRFRNGTSQVSLYIGRSDAIKLPDFQKALYAGTEYYRHVCAECQVICWKRGDTVIIAVSENKKLDLPAFITAVESV